MAAFYSISNCQPGLRGVSLGNFLIKRVAEQLHRELPRLRTFCTLSPIPGFAAWLARGEDFAALPSLKRPAVERALQARAALQEACGGDWSKLDAAAHADALQRLAAIYLAHVSTRSDGDPVARFHLDNGARLERLNPGANVSRKGLKQAHGLMVNYLYDLARIESSHEAFTQGEVVHSRAIAQMI